MRCKLCDLAKRHRNDGCAEWHTPDSSAALAKQYGLRVMLGMHPLGPIVFFDKECPENIGWYPAIASKIMLELFGTPGRHAPVGRPYAVAAVRHRGYLLPAEAIFSSAFWWIPQQVADEMALVTQRYIGWFHGAEVQMEGISHLGKAVGPWFEPFVPPCDHELCRTMSDADVARRLRGYEMTMRVEVANLSPVTYPRPIYSSNEAPDETWEQTYDRSTPGPGVLRSYRLRDLPPHLQRSLVIEWNHIMLASDHAGFRAILEGQDERAAFRAYLRSIFERCYGPEEAEHLVRVFR